MTDPTDTIIGNLASGVREMLEASNAQLPKSELIAKMERLLTEQTDLLSRFDTTNPDPVIQQHMEALLVDLHFCGQEVRRRIQQ